MTQIHPKNLGRNTEALQGEYLKNGFLHACSAPKIKNNLSSDFTASIPILHRITLISVQSMVLISFLFGCASHLN